MEHLILACHQILHGSSLIVIPGLAALLMRDLAIKSKHKCYKKRRKRQADCKITIKTLSGKRTAIVQIIQEPTGPASLSRYWIYGENPVTQPPFRPGAWDAAAMRFNDTEGAHLPTIPDDVYFGLKTLIFDVSDVSEDFDLKIMNGWWSNTYYDHVKWVDGLNELPITDTMGMECAKGGEGRDLDLMLYSGTMTIKSVFYEE